MQCRVAAKNSYLPERTSPSDSHTETTSAVRMRPGELSALSRWQTVRRRRANRTIAAIAVGRLLKFASGAVRVRSSELSHGRAARLTVCRALVNKTAPRRAMSCWRRERERVRGLSPSARASALRSQRASPTRLTADCPTTICCYANERFAVAARCWLASAAVSSGKRSAGRGESQSTTSRVGFSRGAPVICDSRVTQRQSNATLRRCRSLAQQLAPQTTTTTTNN